MKKLALFALTFASLVRAGDLGIAAVGTLNMESPKINVGGTDVATSSSLGLGFGGLATIPLGSLLSLEAGVLYINRKYESGGISAGVSKFQIPAVVRVTALPIVSFGAGAYYEKPLEGSAYGMLNEWGVIASVAADIPLMPLFSLVADLRYNIGLVDVDTDVNNSYKSGGLQFLAGLKFAL